MGGGGYNANDTFLLCFGAWGKVGINCFVLITGYFMCKSSITLKKFCKLMFQILFYKYLIGFIFLATGYEPCTLKSVANILLPFRTLADNFTTCFMVFFLSIPFLNIMVNHLTKRQHELLLLLSVGALSFIPTIPIFSVSFNYIEWFSILYFISSYIRKHPNRLTENRRLWGFLALAAFICGIVSVHAVTSYNAMLGKHVSPFYFLADSNKFTALAASLAFFLAFKPTNEKTASVIHHSSFLVHHSALINTIASATFGVLLIHANSDTMRRWLWHDVCHVSDFYAAHTSTLNPQLSTSPLLHGLNLPIVAHAFGCVLAIFTICVIIDLLRQRFIERPLFSTLSMFYTAN